MNDSPPLHQVNPQLRRAPRRPTLRFMLSHPAHAIALGFGSGLSPIAPGTVGTLWAWLAFLVLQRHLSDPQWALLLTAGLLVGGVGLHRHRAPPGGGRPRCGGGGD